MFNRKVSVRNSRSSGRSGSEEFRRGSLANHSFDRFRKASHIPSAEDEAFALRVKETMEKDGEITAGFLDIFKNAQGSETTIIKVRIKALQNGKFALYFCIICLIKQFLKFSIKITSLKS